MIGWLRGTWQDGVVVTTTGVGYVVTSSGAHADGDAVELWVHTVVREDAITLWAFPTRLDAGVFVALLRVQGVGPAVAMAVLRDVGASKLAAAVAAKDPAMVRAKGVGSKTAARIIADVQLPAGVEAAEDLPGAEIAEVLTGLGFDETLARQAAAAAIEQVRDADDATQLATALEIIRQGAPR